MEPELEKSGHRSSLKGRKHSSHLGPQNTLGSPFQGGVGECIF